MRPINQYEISCCREQGGGVLLSRLSAYKGKQEPENRVNENSKDRALVRSWFED